MRKENDFIKVAEFIHKAIQLALKIQKQTGKKIKDFILYLYEEQSIQKELNDLKTQINKFANTFEFYN